MSALADGDGALGLTVVDGQRGNTSLQEFDCGPEWKFPTHIHESIRFYLKLNINGRRFLQPPLNKTIPDGLWPRILSKMTSLDDSSALFYFLKNKAGITAS
jgi:hypothetical protein